MKLQLASFGRMSEELGDYTSRGIEKLLATPRGRELVQIVDPYSYRDRYTMPKVIALGTNDPYWPLEACSLYYDGLPGPRWLSYAPNAGHGLPVPRVAGLVAALGRHVAGIEPLPEIDVAVRDGGECIVTCNAPPERATLWRAASATRDFRKASWSAEDVAGAGPEWRVPIARAAGRLFGGARGAGVRPRAGAAHAHQRRQGAAGGLTSAAVPSTTFFRGGVAPLFDRRRRRRRLRPSRRGQPRHQRGGPIRLIRSRHICRTLPGLTLGFFFLAWPMRPAAACSLPPCTSATIFGLAASSSWQSATSSSSPTAAIPSDATTSATVRPDGEHLGEDLAAAAGVEVALLHAADQVGHRPRADRELRRSSRRAR